MSIDVRSRLGRRVADLAEDFAQRLGGWASLSDTMIASIRRAAELSSLAEEVRTNALRDGNIDPIGLDWFTSASRAVRALQLDRPREPEPMRSRNISPPMALLSPGGARAVRQGWFAKRDVRPDVPPAKGILRDDLDLRRRRPQVIRIERHEEVRPGIWRYTVPGFGIEGRSRQPPDACRQIRAILGDTSQRAGLFRDGRTEADITCPVNKGALLTVEDGPKGSRFRKYREFDRLAADDIAEAAE